MKNPCAFSNPPHAVFQMFNALHDSQICALCSCVWCPELRRTPLRIRHHGVGGASHESCAIGESHNNGAANAIVVHMGSRASMAFCAQRVWGVMSLHTLCTCILYHMMGTKREQTTLFVCTSTYMQHTDRGGTAGDVLSFSSRHRRLLGVVTVSGVVPRRYSSTQVLLIYYFYNIYVCSMLSTRRRRRVVVGPSASPSTSRLFFVIIKSVCTAQTDKKNGSLLHPYPGRTTRLPLPTLAQHIRPQKNILHIVFATFAE